MFLFRPHLTISLGPFTLSIWGLFFVLGFLAATGLALSQAKKEAIERKKIIDLAFWLILAGFLGARFFYVLEHLSYFLSSPLDILKIWQGGLSFYGGLIGGVLAGFIYIKKNQLSLYRVADIIIFSLPIGIFFTRIGCFLINGHPGRLTSLPWAIDFGQGFRHPVSLYLALNALVMFLVMTSGCHSEAKPKNPVESGNARGFFASLRFAQNDNKKRGLIKLRPTFIFLFWYPISRFLLDFFRAADLPEGDPRLLGLTIAQWVSLGLVLGLGGWSLSRKSR